MKSKESMTFIQDLTSILDRDLRRVRREIEAYQSEKVLWAVDHGIKNCGGNLALHIIGNLNAYIGAVLGESGYVRKRDQEFRDKDVPRQDIVDALDQTRSMINQVLGSLNHEVLETEYPLTVFDKPTTVRFFLMHLGCHLNYHLGQINYHRRLLDHP